MDAKQFMGYALRHRPVHMRKVRPILPEIQPFEKAGVLPKVGCTRIAVTKSLPVLLLPAGLVQVHVADETISIGSSRNSQPACAICGLDPVSGAPITCRVLDVIEKNELVHIVDDVEIPLPRNIRRLNDGDLVSAHDARQAWRADSKLSTMSILLVICMGIRAAMPACGLRNPPSRRMINACMYPACTAPMPSRK